MSPGFDLFHWKKTAVRPSYVPTVCVSPSAKVGEKNDKVLADQSCQDTLEEGRVFMKEGNASSKGILRRASNFLLTQDDGSHTRITWRHAWGVLSVLLVAGLAIGVWQINLTLSKEVLDSLCRAIRETIARNSARAVQVEFFTPIDKYLRGQASMFAAPNISGFDTIKVMGTFFSAGLQSAAIPRVTMTQFASTDDMTIWAVGDELWYTEPGDVHTITGHKALSKMGNINQTAFSTKPYIATQRFFWTETTRLRALFGDQVFPLVLMSSFGQINLAFSMAVTNSQSNIVGMYVGGTLINPYFADYLSSLVATPNMVIWATDQDGYLIAVGRTKGSTSEPIWDVVTGRIHASQSSSLIASAYTSADLNALASDVSSDFEANPVRHWEVDSGEPYYVSCLALSVAGPQQSWMFFVALPQRDLLAKVFLARTFSLVMTALGIFGTVSLPIFRFIKKKYQQRKRVKMHLTLLARPDTSMAMPRKLSSPDGIYLPNNASQFSIISNLSKHPSALEIPLPAAPPRPAT